MDNYKQDAYKELARRELSRRNEEKKSSLLQNAAEDVNQYIKKPVESLGRSARDFIGGGIQGLANIPPNLYNLGAWVANKLGANLPKSPTLDFVPHSPSAEVGDIASFFAGPGLIKSGVQIPRVISAINRLEQIPHVAKALKSASDIFSKSPTLTNIGTNSILGGAYSPDNPLAGIALGGVGGVAGEGAGKLYKYIKESPNISKVPANIYNDTKNSLKNNELLQNIYNKFDPKMHQNHIENLLSSGSNNFAENGRNLASDLRNAYNMRKEESSVFFNHVMKNAGNEHIYEPSRMITSTPFGGDKTIGKLKNLDLDEPYKIFQENPTLSNAHQLRQQIGSMQSKLEKNPFKDKQQDLELGKLKSGYSQLTNDMYKFLEKRDALGNQPLLPMFQRGIDLHRENVAPFLKNDLIREATQEGHTDVKNLHSAFEYPSNKINKEGIEKVGDINKIIQDLPTESKNRILFGAIGGSKQNPEKLLNKLLTIKSKGYESYFTPELKHHISEMQSKLGNRAKVKKYSSALGAAGIGYEGINLLKHLF